MNPVQKSVIAGFGNDVEDYVIYAKQGDTERTLKIQLVDELASYVIRDVSYIFLKEKFSNDIILPPINIADISEISEDGTEITMQLTADMLAVSGVAKCELVFCTCNSVPEITEDGKIIADDLRILSTKHFSIFIDGTVYDGGTLSPIDQDAYNNLLPILYMVQDIIEHDQEYQEHEVIRMQNEDDRIAAEDERKIYENTRRSNETQRIADESVRQSAEATRELAETARVAAENERVTAETARDTAETQRRIDTETAISRANTISADLEEKVRTNYYAGKDFHIAKTYPSIADMMVDYGSPDLEIGDFVMVASNVEDPDNSKMYVITDSTFVFVTDLSGATGMKGESGNAASVQVGNVYNVTDPADTKVLNTGDQYNAVLDFYLLKGEKGDKGDGGDVPDIEHKVRGAVIPDGTTITMDSDGTIHGASELYWE